MHCRDKCERPNNQNRQHHHIIRSNKINYAPHYPQKATEYISEFEETRIARNRNDRGKANTKRC